MFIPAEESTTNPVPSSSGNLQQNVTNPETIIENFDKPNKSTEKIYQQKYRSSWEHEFKGWLTGMPSDPHKAFCTACHTAMNAHKATISKHANTAEHLESVKSLGIVIPLAKFVKYSSNEQKVAEIELSVHIAEHSAIQSVDHLGEFLRKKHSDSRTLANLKLHRKKCTSLITNVIAPCLHKELVKDVMESHSYYSLVFDESTDVSSEKILGIMIRYYSEVHKTVITTLYTLLSIEDGDAESQVSAILGQLSKDNIPIDQMIGIGVDGANVNVGRHHSISTLLREKIPHLVVFKCICHTLHLAASYAMDILPRHLDYMIQETCSWFTCSTKRQKVYKQIYRTMCDGENPSKMGRYAETRWLSRVRIVKRILNQWDSLKLHFEIARSNERCYKADQLFCMFSDPINKVYMTFLCGELEAITKLNTSFQAEKADVTKLFGDLNDYYTSLLQKIIPPSTFQTFASSKLSSIDFSKFLMPPSAIHLGYSVHILIDNFGIPSQTVEVIKGVCFKYLTELALQVQKRLPDNLTVLKDLDLLSPKNATSQMKSSIIALASKFPTVAVDIDSVEREWKLLPTKTWSCTDNIIRFWSEISDTKNAGGERAFENISKLALALLSLPFSNASIERCFSQMSAVKSQLRNRLLVKNTNAILQVKYGLTWRREDCITFKVTPDMVQLFKTSMYKTEDSEDENQSDISTEMESIYSALSQWDSQCQLNHGTI